MKKNQDLFYFLIGFFVGVIFYLGKMQRGITDEIGLAQKILYRVTNYQLDVKMYFQFLLQRRLGIWVMLTVAAVTILGIWIIRLFYTWTGVCFGSVLTMFLMEYGIHGILYLFFLLFPQMLLYVPTFYLLGQLLILVCKRIYGGGQGFSGSKREQKIQFVQKILYYLLLLMVAIIGIFLESYVNPYMVKKMLDFF